MKTKEKLAKPYDKNFYQRKLKKATRELNRLEKLVCACSSNEQENALRQYRAAKLKVMQLQERLAPPKATYEMDIIPLNAYIHDK